MTLLTLELESEIYEHLRREAVHRGSTVEEAAEAMLIEQLVLINNPVQNKQELDSVTTALKRAGLLADLSDEEKNKARQVDMTLEEAINALDAAKGIPLSELIIEMRGSKV